jgi:hypothetical protein
MVGEERRGEERRGEEEGYSFQEDVDKLKKKLSRHTSSES